MTKNSTTNTSEAQTTPAVISEKKISKKKDKKIDDEEGQLADRFEAISESERVLSTSSSFPSDDENDDNEEQRSSPSKSGPPASSVPPVVIQANQVISGAEAAMVKDAVAKQFASLKDFLLRSKAQGHKVERKNFIAVKVMKRLELYAKQQGVQPNTTQSIAALKNKEFFAFVAKLLPQEGGEGRGLLPTVQFLEKELSILHWHNIERLNAPAFRAYSDKFSDILAKVETELNSQPLNEQETEFLVDLVIDKLKKGRENSKAKAVATFFVAEMKKKDIQSLEDFIVEMGQTFYALKKSNDFVQQAGLIQVDEPTNKINNHKSSKRKEFKRKSDNKDHVKKKKRIEDSDDDDSSVSSNENKKQKKQTDGTTSCQKCGRKHMGECKIAQYHPNVNKSDQPFAESKNWTQMAQTRMG